MEDAPNQLTVEEELLAALLDANEALVAALRMYDDLARVATERATEEKSRKDVKMDRQVGISFCSGFISIQANFHSS